MLVRIFLGAIVAAIVGFAWGFVYWAMLGSGQRLMAPLPNETALVELLKESGLASGMYAYPAPFDMDDAEAFEIHEQQCLAGPKLQIAYLAEGGPSMPPMQYAKGVGHYFVVALVAGVLLSMVRSSLPKYGQRVLFVILLGLVSTIWSDVADAVWFMHSRNYTCGRMIESLVTALLIGIVLAAFIKPCKKSAG